MKVQAGHSLLRVNEGGENDEILLQCSVKLVSTFSIGYARSCDDAATTVQELLAPVCFYPDER